MRTEGLRINQLSEAGFAWYLDYLAALDAKDIAQFGSFLAEGCVMQMNNDDPVAGKAAILEGLSGYWSTFNRIEHDLLNLYGTDEAFALEALNHYTRRDDSRVTLRAVALTDRDSSGLVTSFRLYTDTGPLFAS